VGRRQRAERQRWLEAFQAEHDRTPADEDEFLRWVDDQVLERSAQQIGEANVPRSRETGFRRLNKHQAREIEELLAPARHAWRVIEARGKVGGVEVSTDVQPVRAIEALREIDERLARFPVVKEVLVERAKRSRERTRKNPRSAGRRRVEEGYWLAREIADILEGVSGVEVKASKGERRTIFMRVLEICFNAVGHYGSIERYAVVAAKPHRPVTIDEETWQTYLGAMSKRRKPTR
jgi:hypothetical protein